MPSAEINPDGGLEGTRTLKRLLEAVRLWQGGQYDLIVLSGGAVSVSGISDAQIMYDWLVKRIGFRGSYKPIGYDGRARDTFENVSNTLWIIKDAQWRCFPIEDITVVTDWPQGVRFWLSFRGYGFKNVEVKTPPYKLSIGQWLLELFVLIPMHFLDPRGKNWLARWNCRYRSRRAQRAPQL